MKTLLALLMFAFLFVHVSYAQLQGQDYIDSLLNKLPNAKEDTNKVNTYNKLSFAYFEIQNTAEGLKYGFQGLSLAEKIKWKQGIATSNYFIGKNYFRQENYVLATKYYLKSAAMFKERRDKHNETKVLLDLVISYRRQWNYPMALEANQKALSQAKELQNKEVIARATYSIGNTFYSFKNFKKALTNFKSAEVMFRELDDKIMVFTTIEVLCETYNYIGNHKETIAQCRRTIQEEEKYLGKNIFFTDGLVTARRVMAESFRKKGMLAEAIAYNLAAKDVAIKNQIALWELVFIDRGLGITLLDAAKTVGAILPKNTSKEDTSIYPYLNISFIPSTFMGKVDLCIFYLKSCLDRSASSSELIVDCTSGLYRAYQLKGDFKKAFEYQNMYVEMKDSIFGDEQHHKMEALEINSINEIYQKEKTINELELRNTKNEKSLLLIGLFLLFLTSGFIYNRYRMKNKANKIISKEKARSELLLLNILPYEVAEELKEKGSSDAQLIEQVTVLFTDFKGFTALSEQLSPKALVNDLHECFSLFDHICEKYGIEKIKTIGDAYMAAGGLPVPNNTHVKDVTKAALEMAEVVEEAKNRKIEQGLPFFEIRIGVHTGPVVAGIVGVKKFAYDIWGDTVNTASRMESSGEVGRVNISEVSYELIKTEPEFCFESRGGIEAKGKGQLNMYFVSKA